MHSALRHLLTGLCAAAGLWCTTATATEVPTTLVGNPAASASASEPKVGETNAERAKTQPGNNAPFWRSVRESGTVGGVSSLPGVESGTLIQAFTQYPGSKVTNAGEAWRQVRNQWIVPYGGALLCIVGLALALFYWRKGPLGGHVSNTGRNIERFTYFERAAHWSNAIAFCALALSGIVMAFGKFFLLPIVGGTAFGWLTYALKNVHNFAGPLFAVSLTLVFFTFVRDNFPKAGDLAWLLKGGGLFGSHEIPSHRFNAGEKVLFWGGVLVMGSVVVVSGLVLDKVLPGLTYTRSQMQIMHMVHAISATLMMTMFMAHIYIGTVGMRGAYRAMRTGYVDEGWAKEHHEYWFDDIKAGRIPAHRTASPSPSGQPAT